MTRRGISPTLSEGKRERRLGQNILDCIVIYGGFGKASKGVLELR